MHAAEIQRAVDAAPRLKLPEVAALLWQAFAEGHVTEAEAESLQAEIEARQAVMRPAGQRSANALVAGISPRPAETPTKLGISQDGPDRTERPRSRAGSKPRTDASMERRRRWAASGRLPPTLAAHFTLAEQAALAVIAAETVKRGDCRLALGQIAALAGVSETTVRNALHHARQLGLVSIEERRRSGWRNDTNVIRILSPDWTAWLRLARKTPSVAGRIAGGGCKSPNRTNTQVSDLVRSGTWKPSRQSGISQSSKRCGM